MWFGILTPGAHPSRATAIAEATIFAWTPDDRRRIDGPFAAVHGGLRVVRRMFHDDGLEPCPPRCFVCLRACPVPGLDGPDRAALPEAEAVAPVRDALAVRRGGAAGRARLAFVHLAALDGPGDPPLDEEVTVVVPDRLLALLTPLDRVADTLALVARADPDRLDPTCSRCGTTLPGSDAQRARKEAGGTRRERRGRQRRAA